MAPEQGIPLRDVALPGLGCVTDQARLSSWLSEATGTSLSAVPRRLRYKPGTSLVLAVDVLPVGAPDGDPATRSWVVRSYAPHSADKARKAVNVVPPGSVIADDQQRLLVATTAAGDRALPLLARLAAPEGLRAVVGRVLPDRPELASASLRTLRHNPGRRWVGMLEVDGTPAGLLRGYPSREVRGHARTYAALTGGSPRTPRALGSSRSLGVVAVEWVAGQDLSASCDRSEWVAAGASISRLHRREGLSLRHVRSREEAAKVCEAADLLAHLLPDVAAEVTALAADVRRRLRRLERERTPVHGDFSADQVIVSRDGTALIDLDRARIGDPAADLGCAVAEVMTRAEEDGDVGRGRRLAAALVEGYTCEGPLPASAMIATQALAFRIRKAIEPFRACRPDWPVQVRARIDRTQAAHAMLRGGEWG